MGRDDGVLQFDGHDATMVDSNDFFWRALGKSEWDSREFRSTQFQTPGNFKSRQYYGKHVVVFKLLGTGRDDGVLQFDGHDDG